VRLFYRKKSNDSLRDSLLLSHGACIYHSCMFMLLYPITILTMIRIFYDNGNKILQRQYGYKLWQKWSCNAHNIVEECNCAVTLWVWFGKCLCSIRNAVHQSFMLNDSSIILHQSLHYFRGRVEILQLGLTFDSLSTKFSGRLMNVILTNKKYVPLLNINQH